MNIYLIRHGEAEKINPGLNDQQRSLTKIGTDILTSALILWRSYINRIDIIHTSPLLRAVQTAEIVGEYFQIREKIRKDKSVAPGFNPGSLIELASEIKAEEIAFVGHQPDIGDILSELISTGLIRVEIKPATIIKVAFNRHPAKGKGILEFIIPPPLK